MNANKALIALTAALALHTTAALAVVFTSNTTIAIGVTTYDGQPIIVSNCTLTVNGPHPFTSLLVTSNGVVTHSPAPAGQAANSLNLTIGQDATVETGSRIDVSASGYGAQSGPGQGSYGYYGASGAGYGGEGGGSGGTNYGSITAPVDFGSGGGNGGYGPGGAGGGIVRLSVGGTLTVLGQILANGQNIGGGNGGGGSGGSVYLTAGVLAGSGVIRATGGDGYKGGAGGRIALYYTTSTFTGTATAFGGTGSARGGAGTIYLKAASQPAGTVIVDNGGTVGGSTPISTPIAFNLVITNRAVVYPKSALTLNSLTVATNGLLTHLPTQLPGLDLTVTGDVTIEAGGVISADGKGYGAQSGPGQGAYAYYGGGGAGYGGEGGSALGGTNYGSITAPVDFGSGGGNDSGGVGGGIVRLSVGGTLTVWGQILANGQSAGSREGGGSGGSVYVTAGILAGSGAIRTTGGDGANGGAGGRIALYYTTSTFTGAATAFGGAGSVRGGAGTIYTKAAGLSTGDVLVDNGGTNGAMTWLTSPVAFNVTVTNAGIVRPQAALNLASLLVASNGMVVYPSAQPGFALAVQGDATVENGGAILASCNLTIHGNLLIAGGGAISANGKGFGTDAGPGKGTADYNHASGAGYGGPGGRNSGGSSGGTVYGSLLQPVDLGSGGGSPPVCGGCPGGAGGGAVRLNVDGTLTVNGQLTANGTDGAGGGSGGSLFVSAGTLTGIGMIAATGGATGDAYAGGGGGGRIALYYGSSTFAGTVSAVGGLGGASAYSGGPGTIYTKPNSQAFGALLVDGTGRTNAMEAPITSPVPFALILSNATVYPNGALLLGSLLITTNATITHPAGGPQIQIAVLGDATIDAGAGMAVDGRGYGSSTGPGHGLITYSHGSGAGYGGKGGDCSLYYYPEWSRGGPAYGSMTAPVDFGSGGGANGYGNLGGAGGGAIRLSVAGTLLVNGRVTADGRGGIGGGSGGSVFLTVGRLAGNGAITANGGASNDTYGGGGGGGRIAIYSDTNVFIGTMTASGAAGYNWGESGTIYLATNVAPIVIAQYPSGPVNRFVSYVDLTFNQPVDPATFTTNDLVLTAPSGPIPASQITLTGGGGVTWRVGFPTQSANGAYSFTVGPHIANLFGQEMETSYSGGFTVNFTTPTATASQTGGNLSLIWSSATGLSYQLQSATNLPTASWANEGAPINGTGSLLTNSLPFGVQPRKFFRLLLLEN